MGKIASWTLAGLLIAVPAFAQTPTRSIEDYECGLDPASCAAAPAEAEPATPGQRGKARVSSGTRGFSLSNTAKPAKPTKPIAPKNAAANVGKPGQRVDLLLSFQVGSDALTPAAMAEARVFAQALSRPKLASMRFAIEGHTDLSGGADKNLDLSRRRAQSAANYLAAQGVDPKRLEVRGLGYSQPLPGRSASSPDNRRVEAVRLN